MGLYFTLYFQITLIKMVSSFIQQFIKVQVWTIKQQHF